MENQKLCETGASFVESVRMRGQGTVQHPFVESVRMKGWGSV